MNIEIIAVGRIKKSPEREQIETYVKRCPWKIKITEVEERRPLKGAERMAREAELILAAIPEDAWVIALDEHGKQMRSKGFCKKNKSVGRTKGLSTLVFLIGGADGYDQKIKDSANGLISFGEMTWPHMMVRAMLSEQLYRASAILQGHPYHKD